MTQTNKAPLLTKISLVFFILGLLSLITKNFMPEWVDASGMLYEPYFFMIPLGFLSVFLGLILGSVAFIKNMTGLKK
jgi:polyferredoxin